MSQAHERWFAVPGKSCRFCGNKVGAVFEDLTDTQNRCFHLDCLITSWQRGEERVQTILKIEEEVRRIVAENAQLKTALRNRTPGGSVSGFADDLRRASQQPAPTPAAPSSTSQARGPGFAIAPKPPPVAPKPAPVVLTPEQELERRNAPRPIDLD